MAFTTTQKVQIRGYLGYRLDSDEIDFRLDSVSAEAELEVERLLVEIVDVEARLKDARDLAGLKKVNLIEFYQSSVASDLWTSGNSLVSRLARALGVEVSAFPFGSQASSGGGPGFTYFGP